MGIWRSPINVMQLENLQNNSGSHPFCFSYPLVRTWVTNLFLIFTFKLYFPSTLINLLSYLSDAWGLSVKENIWVTGSFTVQCKGSFRQIALSCWQGSTVNRYGNLQWAIYSDLSVNELSEQQRSNLHHQPTPPCKKKRWSPQCQVFSAEVVFGHISKML